MTYSHDLQIVTHVYAKRLPMYAQLLRFHLLGSFAERKPDCRVRVDVFYDEDDKDVAGILEAAEGILDGHVVLVGHVQQPRKLFRRAIGRNLICGAPAGAVIWFADTDYVFGPGACEAAAALGPDAELSMPECVLRNIAHSDGADELADQKGCDIPLLNPSRYEPYRERKAIGGIQIIGANVAERIGYCRGTHWLQPVDPAKGFSCFRDDSAWRRVNKLGYGRPVPIPNVYRIRHAESGFSVERKPQ